MTPKVHTLLKIQFVLFFHQEPLLFQQRIVSLPPALPPSVCVCLSLSLCACLSLCPSLSAPCLSPSLALYIKSPGLVLKAWHDPILSLSLYHTHHRGHQQYPPAWHHLAPFPPPLSLLPRARAPSLSLTIEGPSLLFEHGTLREERESSRVGALVQDRAG